MLLTCNKYFLIKNIVLALFLTTFSNMESVIANSAVLYLYTFYVKTFD